MEDSLQQNLAATALPREASCPASAPLSSTLPVAHACPAPLAAAALLPAGEALPELASSTRGSAEPQPRNNRTPVGKDKESFSAARRETMTVDEVAAFLGVDRKTIYAAVLRNEIPHRRMGKRILFSRDAVTVWLRGTCKGSSESALR